MPFWAETFFMEANSPAMEQMIMFYDYTMTIMFSILMFLMLSMMIIKMNNIYNLYLLENQMIEMIWTILPMFILIFIAAPSLRLLYLMEETFSPDLTIKITGYQWFWHYEYPEFELEFESFLDNNIIEEDDTFRMIESDNYISIPLEMITQLLVTSMDVIHSWTIQSMGVKMDAIPGRLNQMNIFPIQPGLFYGQCSEICGANHSFMPISLEILELEDFILYPDTLYYL